MKNLIKQIPGARYIYSKYLSLRNVRLSSKKNIFLDDAQIKLQFQASLDIDLAQFLFGDQNLVLPNHLDPLVSIILVVHNKASLTFACLLSILNINDLAFEVIIVDNNSTDNTKTLLSRVKNAKQLTNEVNLHFLLGANQASKIASGQLILFLNNDATLMYGALNTAVNVIKSRSNIGAVGGKVILTNLKLQEAGCIIWGDATTEGYGRGKDPFNSEYMFSRTVDFCSGAFLLTWNHLFQQCNGFDEIFKPAYYEETDYCLTIRKKGYEIVFEPRVGIKHLEFGSSKKTEQPYSLQEKNRAIFLRKHRDLPANKTTPRTEANETIARCKGSTIKILFIDEWLPHIHFGAGYPRANSIINALSQLNASITIYPLYNQHDHTWSEVYVDIPKTCEVMVFGDYYTAGLRKFLIDRQQYFDLILISRPTCMTAIGSTIANFLESTRIPIVYDAESIYALKRYPNIDFSDFKELDKDVTQEIHRELSLCRIADAIIAVSTAEAGFIKRFTNKDVVVIGHSGILNVTSKSYEERDSIIFLGAVHSTNSPNAQSIMWFVKKILPLILAARPKIVFNIVGLVSCKDILSLQSDNVVIHGFVQDPYEIFNSAKVFVAPTLQASGLPHKVLTAALFGVPIVTTSLISRQLGWNSSELLVADTAENFSQHCLNLFENRDIWSEIRNKLIDRVSMEIQDEQISEKLECLLVKLLPHKKSAAQSL